MYIYFTDYFLKLKLYYAFLSNKQFYPVFFLKGSSLLTHTRKVSNIDIILLTCYRHLLQLSPSFHPSSHFLSTNCMLKNNYIYDDKFSDDSLHSYAACDTTLALVTL